MNSLSYLKGRFLAMFFLYTTSKQKIVISTQQKPHQPSNMIL